MLHGPFRVILSFPEYIKADGAPAAVAFARALRPRILAFTAAEDVCNVSFKCGARSCAMVSMFNGDRAIQKIFQLSQARQWHRVLPAVAVSIKSLRPKPSLEVTDQGGHDGGVHFNDVECVECAMAGPLHGISEE